jgi:hypothetical protein
VRVNGEDGDGGAIEIEVWALAPEAFASLVDAVPAPLVIGRVVLADGSDVAGFLCESIAVRGATDITIGEKIDRHRAIARVGAAARTSGRIQCAPRRSCAPWEGKWHLPS